MAHTSNVTLKELFQAAQQDEFQTVQDYLQIVLFGGNESDDTHTAATPSRKSKSSKADQRAALAALLESKTKNTLLHYACDNGNLDACKYLLMLDGMAELFLNEPNAFGHTPLFYAASSGRLPLVKWLISNGADIDTDYSDRSDVAPRDGDHGIFTPLQIACFRGHDDVVNFLVECNAELSGTRRNGKTPLHFACAQNHKSVVKILLDAGADVHACDDQGKTPVDVAQASMLATLLPNEHGGGDQNSDDDDDDRLEAAADDDNDDSDDDDATTESRERKQAHEAIKSAFGSDISRAFRSKVWKLRVSAITDASLCFQNVTHSKQVLKLFDGACQMIVIGLQDAVTQVVSSCCNTLHKAAFSAVMSEKVFHTQQFHRDRPVLCDITSALLTRGAGSNEKDASEAVASLLFLICKSMDLTRYLTAQIVTIVAVPTPSTTDSSTTSSNSVSWRLQLVSIKILNTIASQYRLDEAASGLTFADTLRISMTSLENSSVHVRTAAIDLLVQCLLIRCEQSGMSGSVDEIYEQMKNWSETIFKQQNQPLKPSIQAKINSGLKNALQGSKRLSAAATSDASALPTKAPTSANAMFGELTPAMSPRAKSAQKEDDLPYAEPIQEQHKDDAVEMLASFGDKVTRCLFSNAWAPRVEALSFLQAQVDARQLVLDPRATSDAATTLRRAMQRTLLQALQDRVNAVFEAGVALLMEVAIAMNASAGSNADRARPQDFVRPLIPRLLVKLGDSKSRLHVTTEDALLLLSRQSHSIGPEFLLDEMIACDRSASLASLSPVYLANKLGVISKLLLEFGVQESSTGDVGALPIKSVLQSALQVCEHKDPSVRLVSLQIVADTLQVARSAAMPFLDALARASRQKIISKLVERGVLEADLLMDEVDDFDVEPSRPGTSGGGIRPPTASGSSTKHRPALSNASLSSASSVAAAQASASQAQPAALPYGTALTSEQKAQYTPLIDSLGEALVRCLLDKTWAQREAAVREIERLVICTANGKLPAGNALPKTIETLRVVAVALELGLNDTVARVFQCSLRLFQIIATDFVPLVTSTHEYVDAVLENVVALVMHKLGDTKQRLRSDCFTLLHALASLNHIGHARMCKMLIDKYKQLVSASTATATSPVLAGELLKLLTLLLKDAHAAVTAGASSSSQQQLLRRPDVSAILELICPALENKHVDVRNAAIATYAAIYETTNGGTDASYGAVDLHSFVAQTKPAIREAITRSVVQLTKAMPSSAVDQGSDNNGGPEIDSARQQSLALDVTRLTNVCGSPTVALLTSVSPTLRCQGIDKLISAFVEKPRDPRFKGAWEICCLLTKQLLLDGTPSVCLAAFELLELLADPPGESVVAAEYAIPWGEWGVHLILGSTVRSVVQQTASESVRVRTRVQVLLVIVATKHAAGRSAVCNALLSAPEHTDLTSERSKRVKKIALTKLRWQMLARLEMLYDLLVASSSSSSTGSDAPSAARRKPASSSSAKQASEALGVDTVVPFLGSCATHPSPSIRAASLKLVRFFQETRADELAKFVQDSCSAALQRRLRALLSSSDSDADGNNNADHFNADDATCVRGSRSSHVRRIAALRPPRSVPVEETKMAVDVFPPPHSAPGKSRRSGGTGADDEDDDSMNDGSYVVLPRGQRDESKSSRQSSESKQQQQQVPIWLDQQQQQQQQSNSRKGGALYGDGEPESALGGGAAGLMKMRRQSTFRGANSSSGNNDNDDESDNRRTTSGRYSTNGRN